MMYYFRVDIYDYTTKGGKNVILDYIYNLPEDIQTVALNIRKAIRKDGYDAFTALTTRKLKGKLYEIKFSNQRIMYVIKNRDSVYFLHICQKQKNKTETKDLQLALNRAKTENLII